MRKAISWFILFAIALSGTACQKSAPTGDPDCDADTDTDSDTDSDSDTDTDPVATSDAVYPGIWHTCAITAETGAIRCWGMNNFGQLGYGNKHVIGIMNTVQSAGDVDLGGEKVVELALGAYHTCALLDGGNVRCWGRNDAGQLGYGNNVEIGDDETPASAGYVDVGGEVIQISAGFSHTCALLSTGQARCWGENLNGQLGYGNTNTIGDDEVPASAGDVDVGGEVAKIKLGLIHSCVLLVNGKIRCWGDSEYGQLGYGNTNTIGDDEVPASAGDVDVGENIVDLSAGGMHNCALFDNGKIRCWGDNENGQLGYGVGINIGDDELPYQAGDVIVGGDVARLALGGLHTCVQLTSGENHCWGDNTNGQLGYGNTTTIGDDEAADTAGNISIGGDTDEVMAGFSHNCSLMANGGVRCWGYGYFGQLGYGNQDNIGDDELPSDAGDVPIY